MNEYSQTVQNTLISSLVIFLSVLDWLLTTFISPILGNATTILQIENMKWSFVLLPIFIFYNNDNSEDKYSKTAKFLDWYYTEAYVALAIVYVILFICVPPSSDQSLAMLFIH